MTDGGGAGEAAAAAGRARAMTSRDSPARARSLGHVTRKAATIDLDPSSTVEDARARARAWCSAAVAFAAAAAAAAAAGAGDVAYRCRCPPLCSRRIDDRQVPVLDGGTPRPHTSFPPEKRTRRWMTDDDE